MAADIGSAEGTSERNYSIKRRFQNRLLPLVGCVGYCTYSVKIVLPKQFSEFFGAFSPRVEDTLWTAAGIGLAVYLYKQKFMTKARTPWRVIYSSYSSTMFNLSSNLLMWVTSEAALRKTSNSVKLLTALGSTLGLLYLGWNFINFLNNLTDSHHNENK